MKTAFVSVALTIVLGACSTTRSVRPIGATVDVEAVDSRVQEGASPTAEDYAAARSSFLSKMSDFLAEQQRATSSPKRKVKSVIVGAGSVLSIGGLVASFIVKDEDQRSTIAQASASVGAVAGIVGLIPVGGGVSGATAAVTYLESELPRFEERWMATKDSIATEEWQFFISDCRHIEATAAELQAIE